MAIEQEWWNDQRGGKIGRGGKTERGGRRQPLPFIVRDLIKHDKQGDQHCKDRIPTQRIAVAHRQRHQAENDNGNDAGGRGECPLFVAPLTASAEQELGKVPAPRRSWPGCTAASADRTGRAAVRRERSNTRTAGECRRWLENS